MALSRKHREVWTRTLMTGRFAGSGWYSHSMYLGALSKDRHVH
jgi:hypothetical protein